VLVAGEHPGDRVEVDAVLLGQDGARPDARGHRVAPVHADLAALEVLRAPDVRADPVADGAVVEAAHQERRDRGELHPVRLRDEVGGEGHLADVELEGADHAPEALDEDRDLLEVEAEPGGGDGPVLERCVVALGAGDGPEQGFGHVIASHSLVAGRTAGPGPGREETSMVRPIDHKLRCGFRAAQE
jgi:hypothetical protein